MKKFLLFALVTLTSLTMSAQIGTKQQHGRPQSSMVRPAEKKVDLSTVQPMKQATGRLVRNRLDYGKKLTLDPAKTTPTRKVAVSANPVSRQLSAAKVAKLQPATGMPLRSNAKKALSTAGLKATKKLASAPRKAAEVKDKYTGSGLDYANDGTTETETPVEWTMTPVTLSYDNGTEVPGFVDIVPEPEMFKAIAGFEDGIPLEAAINGSVITVAPQIIASGENEQAGKFYVWVFGYTNDGSITMTLGEDGSLKTPANMEIIIGALNTDKFALNNNTFLYYYQWTENVKYTFESQQTAVSPFLESYDGAGYDFFQETNVTWTMVPDADNGQFKCFVPAPASLAKYFPEGIDVPYAISGNTVTVAPFYTGLGYTEDDGTRAYLTLFGTADQKTFGDITLTLNDDKSLDVTPGTAVYLGVFLGTEFDPTMKTYDGGYQIIEEINFKGETPETPEDPEADYEFTSDQDYQGYGVDYKTKESVSWPMKRGTLIEGDTKTPALLDIVPQPSAFTTLYPNGIPVAYTTTANSIVIAPQILATTNDGYNVIIFDGNSEDGTITFTLGEGGAITTADKQEIVIGAFLTETVDFTGENYGGYYQITDNIQYLLPNQKLVPTPSYEPEGVYLHSTISVTGYGYYSSQAMMPAYAPVTFKNYSVDPADEWKWSITPYATDDMGETVLDASNATTADTKDFVFNTIGGTTYAPAQLVASLGGESSAPFVWGKEQIDEESGETYPAYVHAGTSFSPFTDGSEPVITRANPTDFDLYYDGNHATPDKARYSMSKLYLIQGKPAAPLYIEGVNLMVYDFQSDDNFSLTCKLVKIERSATGRITPGEVIAESEISNADVVTEGQRSLLRWSEFYVEDEWGMSITLDHMFIEDDFMVVIEGWDNGTFSCYPFTDGYEPSNGSSSIYFEMSDEPGSMYSFTGYCAHLLVGFINASYGYLHTTDDTDVVLPVGGGEAMLHVEPMLFSVDEETQEYTTRLFVDEDVEVPEWLTMEIANEKYDEEDISFDLKFSADALPAGTQGRSAVIPVWQEGAQLVITVTQGNANGISTTVTSSKVTGDKLYRLNGMQARGQKGIVVAKNRKYVAK